MLSTNPRTSGKIASNPLDTQFDTSRGARYSFVLSSAQNSSTLVTKRRRAVPIEIVRMFTSGMSVGNVISLAPMYLTGDSGAGWISSRRYRTCKSLTSAMRDWGKVRIACKYCASVGKRTSLQNLGLCLVSFSGVRRRATAEYRVDLRNAGATKEPTKGVRFAFRRFL